MGIQYYTEPRLVQSCSVRGREKLGVAGGADPRSVPQPRVTRSDLLVAPFGMDLAAFRAWKNLKVVPLESTVP